MNESTSIVTRALGPTSFTIVDYCVSIQRLRFNARTSHNLPCPIFDKCQDLRSSYIYRRKQ